MRKDKKPNETSRTISQLSEKPLSRREFISRLAMGGGALVLLSGCSRWVLPGSGSKEREKIYEYIAVDYTKCTGCRTCEAVCSAANNPVSVDGNVSAPAVCARCTDTPCVNACPVDPDPVSGFRALFQDTNYGTITNDPDRCISCGNCVEACSNGSVGILAQHPETDRPMRMCTLCDGDPQCVKNCPYEAFSLIRVIDDHPYYRMSPEEIAKQLSKGWYDLSA